MPGILFVRPKNIVRNRPQNFCEKIPEIFFYFGKKYYICDEIKTPIKMLYKNTIEQLTRTLGYPELGEAFQGHPDDPTILEEYYL